MTSMRTRGAPRPSAWWRPAAWVVPRAGGRRVALGRARRRAGSGPADDVRRVVRARGRADDRGRRRARRRRPGRCVRRLAADRRPDPARRTRLVRAGVGGLGAGSAARPQHRDGRRRLLLPVASSTSCSPIPAAALPTLAARAVVAAAYVEATLVTVARGAVQGPVLRPVLLGQLHRQRVRGPVRAGAGAGDRGDGPVVHGGPGGRRGDAVRLAGGDRLATGPPHPAARRGAGRPVPAGRGRAWRSRSSRHPLEDPAEPAFRDVFVLQCSALVVLAAALVWGLVRTRLQHRAVSRIASSLGEAPAPGSLEAALGRAVGDPTLRIAYWLPDAATVRRRVRAGRSRRPSPGPAARSPRWSAMTSGSPSCPTPGRLRDRVRDGRRVHAGARQRAAAGRGPRPARGAARLAQPASSRPETSSGGGSSATCTTEPSSGCSPRRTRSGSRRPAPTSAGDVRTAVARWPTRSTAP